MMLHAHAHFSSYNYFQKLDLFNCKRLMNILDLHLQVKPEEITTVMNGFNEPGSLAPTGLYLGGSKYMHGYPR